MWCETLLSVEVVSVAVVAVVVGKAARAMNTVIVVSQVTEHEVARLP